MVQRSSASSLPTIEAVFDDSRIVAAYRNAGYTSVAEIMAMPYEALKTDVKGLGRTRIVQTTRMLRRHKLGHRRYCDKMTDFLAEQFGQVESAPIAVLQIAVVRIGEASRPYFAPLEAIKLLQAFDPEMSIERLTRLLQMSSATVLEIVERQTVITSKQVHNVHEDLRHINFRLESLGVSYRSQREPGILQAVR